MRYRLTNFDSSGRFQNTTRTIQSGLSEGPSRNFRTFLRILLSRAKILSDRISDFPFDTTVIGIVQVLLLLTDNFYHLPDRSVMNPIKRFRAVEPLPHSFVNKNFRRASFPLCSFDSSCFCSWHLFSSPSPSSVRFRSLVHDCQL